MTSFAGIGALSERAARRGAIAMGVVCMLGALPVADARVGQAAPGRIEGQVRLIMPPAPAVPSAVYPTRRVSRPAPKASEITSVVVFLKDPPPRHQDPPLMRATITQKDEAFVPRVVAITRGSTVDFPNSDPFFHNVFSLSRGASFDLGRYPRGDTRTHRFLNAGLVKVYCHIHSHMTASIMVFDHPFFRIPTADGNFTIDNVPAGTYQIVAWHERIGENATSITVEASRATRVEFALPMEPR